MSNLNATPWIRLYSQESAIDRRAYYRFVNASPREVELAWYDYDGGKHIFYNIPPRAFRDIDTFEGHPWQAFEKHYHRALLLRGRFFLCAKRSERLTRLQVLITEPVYSLKSLCLGVLCLSASDDDVQELPRNLIRDLVTYRVYRFTC
ncbi:von Hippel-Lindau disease tumor suppressor-like [Galendromus occidentalis]|uniref:von Hippel-Lindau disease tumor suppressor-like n=1 Tax=Galendromus occidentalis TaxID=34638 RepID=A0AAJ6QRT1_9ACAR|nr:von Hippel-Lindau disease tumor suppressor-like [Galendromus occidentalis]